MDGKQQIQISGSVSQVVYENGENGYTVLRLKSRSDTVTVTGVIPGAAVGEELLLTGAWVSHPSYGQQFKAEYAERRLPDSTAGIREYLASGAVKGVGPVLAAAIVGKFGRDTLEIMENAPERLAEVRGISERQAMSIAASFRARIGLRRLIEFLGAYGVSARIAVRLYRQFGEDAKAAVTSNPYILADDFFGEDFFTADALAIKLGFDADCRERAEAAITYELRHNMGNGHTFLPREKLCTATDMLISVGPDVIDEALDMLIETGAVVSDTIAGIDACYLAKIHREETNTAGRLLAKNSVPVKNKRSDSSLVASVERQLGIEYAGLQREAVELAIKSRVMVLTGGPGTGKTTSVRGILLAFEKLGLKTALTAPTGRAAKRMSELCGSEAVTVHRLLGAAYSDEDGMTTFEKSRDDMLDADAVILDEASMMDISLMSALLDAMPTECRLILVGDADQLPSVGPGNVFSDIIRSGVVPTVRLTEIFRQAGESRIVKSAHMINSGTVPDLKNNGGDMFFISRAASETAAETIADLVSRRLPQNMGIPPQEIQVLSPTRKGECGTFRLNQLLQNAVNPPTKDKREKKFGDYTYREGDRVMQIRNNYDIMWKKELADDGVVIHTSIGSGVFNGDIGHILRIDHANETVTVDFEDRIAEIPFDLLSDIEPAWAMTVHKSQGSEYRAVVLASARAPSGLQTRSVLYTAVTRARELLVMVGEPAVISDMTANDKRQKRYSGLKTRLTLGI